MQKKLRQLILSLLFPLWGLGGFAQSFPVTINTQFTQPSPIYLSNYADATTVNSPIRIQLTLNDLTLSNIQVRLKFYLQGGGVSLVSNDYVVGASPLYLQGGFPTQLTNVELAPYFEFQNLLGINPNEYAQPLREGMYNLYVEVYDFATGKKLSNKTSTTTIIFQNEPPILNLPLNKAGIMQQNIQNIVFSWSPRSINVSNVEYEFALVEITDKYTPVQNAFLYSPPLYTTTTRSTSLVYGIMQPQLIPGKNYAWRVHAKALKGAEEIGVFKNNGNSEVFGFSYDILCNAPTSVTTTGASQDQAKITWSGAIDNYDYEIKYREKGSNSKWYSLITPREYATIANLKPNTTYEYTVGAACELGKYVHGSVQEFTTTAQDEIAIAGCGIKPDPTDLKNKTPLPTLVKNDVVTAGDFPIVVWHATGSNGTFSGDGYVTLPFLEKFKTLIDAADNLAGQNENGEQKSNIGKYSRIKITFTNIGVNTDFKLISGEIVASYDPNWGSILDGDKIEQDLLGDKGKVVPVTVDFVVDKVVKNADGTITITGTGADGKPITTILPKTVNETVIVDKKGQQFIVPANTKPGDNITPKQVAVGGIPKPSNTNGMGSGGNVNQISSKDVTVIFSAGAGEYAFDINPNQDSSLVGNTTLNATYDVIDKADGSKYYVNYKAISDAPQAIDVVTATATFANGKTKDDIVFKTENGTAIPTTWSGNVATLTLKRTFDFAKETVIATIKPTSPPTPEGGAVPAEGLGKYDIAGTLNLWHLTSKKVNVTLVSINKAPIPANAKRYLDSIYRKTGITFDVSTISKEIENTWGNRIKTGDSDLLNTYTDAQQKITENLKIALGSEYNDKTYYMLFTKEKASNNYDGFMPLKRQFGFVFDGKLRTLAHEIGHGPFGLQHPFTQYNTPRGTTNLLMDSYGATGTELSHNDWEILHAPGLQLYQFTQGSSAGAYQGDVYYYNPSGYPFYLNNRGTTNQFCIRERTIIELIPTSDITNGLKINGVIWAWKETDCNSITKTYRAKVENKKFYGYFLDDENGKPTTISYPIYWEGIFNQDSFKNTDFNKVYILEYNGKCKYSFYTSHYIAKGNAPLESDYKNGIITIDNLSNYRDKIFERSGDLKNCTHEQIVELKIYAGEYVNYETYKKIYGNEAFELDNNDWHGAWLLSDREERNLRWKNAMETITRNNWTNVLKPFEQIRDYYLWIQYYNNLKGYKSRWAKGASYLVDELAEAYESGILKTGNTFNWSDNLGSHILQDLNLGIANFAIGQFNKLFFGSDISRAKNDSDAYLWDRDFIEKEQVTVVAFDVYSKYAGTDMLNDLNKMTRKESIGNLGANPYRFIPDFSKVGVNVNDASTQFGASGRFNIPLFMIWTFNHTFDKNIGNAKIGFQKYLLSNDKLNSNYIKTDFVYSTGQGGGSADYKDDFIDQIKKANQLIEEFCNEYKIK
jgi:Fibronectin type III domain